MLELKNQNLAELQQQVATKITCASDSGARRSTRSDATDASPSPAGKNTVGKPSREFHSTCSR